VSKREHYIFVCNNARPDGNPRPSCGKSGASEIFAALKAELSRRGLAKTAARVCTTSCLDMCDHGPAVLVQPENAFYVQMSTERVPSLVQAIVDGTVADESPGIGALAADSASVEAVASAVRLGPDPNAPNE
jgi:(2Fe-2S) ferredoxin